MATQADARLRADNGQVAGIIDTAIGKIKLQVDELASATAAARAVPQGPGASAPPPAPGLDGHYAGQIDEIKAKYDDMGRAIEHLQQHASTIEGCVSDTEGMFTRHDKGLVRLDGVVRRLDGLRQAAPQQPSFGTNFGADFQG